jgi:DnaK suppressor protein
MKTLPRPAHPAAVPPQWAWHFRTLTHLRDRLQRAQAEHASQAIAPPDVGGNDPADSAQDRLDRDLLWAELGAENERLSEIDGALQRIRDGVFGFCEQTGRPIPPERLRAIPWTRYCVDAAEAHEGRPHPGDGKIRA